MSGDSFFSFNSKRIRFRTEGFGPSVLLLHGYLETLDVWKEFSNKLKKNFQIITIDIPGHSYSDVIDNKFDFSNISKAINELLISISVNKVHIVGHSMGGYLALDFCKLFPEKTNSICLFHSTPYADSEEKKQNRKREIEFIEQGKKDLIFNTNISRTFADENVEKFGNEIEKLKSNARLHSENGIIYLLNCMINRQDNTNYFKNLNIPNLLILGQKDNYINIDFGNNIQQSVLGEKVILQNSGHMGFIEEEQKSKEILEEFWRR